MFLVDLKYIKLLSSKITRTTECFKNNNYMM